MVATAIPFFVAGILWLASVDSKATEARNNAAEAKDRLNSVGNSLVDIRERLIRIEDGMNTPYKKSRGEK